MTATSTARVDGRSGLQADKPGTASPVTFITGTTSGIGAALVAHYLERGHRVVGLARREAVVQHERYRHLQADVTDEVALRAAFAEVRRGYGRLDHLINNAGTASMNHAMLTTARSVERLLKVNVQGTFLAAREAAKVMQRQHFGRIVNFTTVAVPLALDGEAAYVASKAAVEGLTRVLAREFAPFGVTVNAVGPTPVKTALIAGVPDAAIAALVGRQAITRLGTMADVANVVDFFLSPESGFVTGQVVYLGGVS